MYVAHSSRPGANLKSATVAEANDPALRARASRGHRIIRESMVLSGRPAARLASLIASKAGLIVYPVHKLPAPPPSPLKEL